MKLNFGIPRGTLPRKRDMQRMVNVTGGRIREPISAKLKKQALVKAKGKCQWPGCKEKDILDFHHKDMRSDHNTLKNIMVLCPTHHRKMHQKFKLKKEKNMIGQTMRERIVKVKAKKKTAKKKTKTKTTKKKTKNKATSDLNKLLWGGGKKPAWSI